MEEFIFWSLDDEQDSREVLAEVLSRCKATVTTAGSVAEALRLSRARGPPDVVVSDIGIRLAKMDMTSFESCRALPPERGGRTPAIALTACTLGWRIEPDALVSGFNMHVPKPVERTSELYVVVAQLVKSARSRCIFQRLSASLVAGCAHPRSR